MLWLDNERTKLARHTFFNERIKQTIEIIFTANDDKDGMSRSLKVLGYFVKAMRPSAMILGVELIDRLMGIPHFLSIQ